MSCCRFLLRAFVSALFAVCGLSSHAFVPPYPLPAPGTAIALGSHVAQAIRPAPHYESSWQYTLFDSYGGGVFVPWFSSAGAYVIAGTGGHNHPDFTGAVAFDFQTGTWKLLPDASGTPVRNYSFKVFETNGAPEYEINIGGTTPNSVPAPPHPYANLMPLAPELGGGPLGSVVYAIQGAQAQEAVLSSRSHRFDLSTRTWSRYTSNHLGTLNSRLAENDAPSVYDPTAKRIWQLPSQIHSTQTIGYIDLTEANPQWRLSASWPYVSTWDQTHSAWLDDTRRLILMQSPTRLVALDLNNLAAGPRLLKFTGTLPPSGNRWEYYPPDGRFYYKSYSGNVLWKLTPPAGDPFSGTWAVTSFEVTGATLPSITPAAQAAGLRHFTRFFYVPSIAAFAWMADSTSAVHLIRPPADASGPPPTVSLAATPTAVFPGSRATLSWSSTNATSCSASGAWSGVKGVSGSEVTEPLTAPASYTLTCGSAVATVTVLIRNSPPPPPTVTLTADPNPVQSGSAARLTWSSTNASSCTASGAWSGSRASSGSESTLPLTAPATYTLTCGSAVATVTVNTVAPTPGPSLTFTVLPTTVDAGSAVTLNWSATNASSCTPGGAWAGTVIGVSGTTTAVPVANPSIYTLRCSGSAGVTPEQSVTVTVRAVAPPPGAITTVKLVNTGASAQTNAVATFGHAFKQGDVPVGSTVVGKDASGNPVTLQVDRKATHADGSLKHAVLTVKLASVAAGATQAITLSAQSSPTTTPTPVALASLLATSFDSQVSLNLGGTVYTASARNLLQTTPARPWLSGPEVSEWIVGGPVRTAAGAAHPHLTAYFHVRAYAGSPITRVRVDAVVENNWTFRTGTTAFTYVPSVTVGGATIYNNGGANLTHYDHARWHQVGWWNNSDSKIFVKPDTRYLRDTRLVPNYANVQPRESLLNGYAQTVVPFGIANLRPLWSPGGAHAQIGLMPEWYASYVMSDGDIRAYNAVLANDSAGGSFSYHYRDENTGLPVSIDTYPNISEQDPGSLVLGTGNNPNRHDAEHQPLIGYLAYLLTGDYYYLEELQFLANWGMLWRTAPSRGYSAGIIGGQRSPTGNREIAWAVRTQAAAGAITPSDAGPLKAYFSGKATNNLDVMSAEWGLTSPNTLGIRLDVGYSDAGYYAPWQMDFLVAVVNFAVDLGYSGANAVALRNTFNKWPTGRMGQNNSGYCPYYAALYNFGNDATDRGVISNGVYRTFAELYRFRFPAESAQPCPTTGVMRSGYGNIDTVDYYANVMQPALAMAVDSGVATQATWDKFVSIAPADYSLGGTWGIVPRTAGGSAAPNLTLTANPGQVAPGGGTTLSWTATNAVGCTAPWTTSRAVSGSQPIANIASTTNYSMTCTGPGGSTTRTATVTVTAPVPALTLSADATSVAYNGSTTLRWTSTNAAACAASGAWSGSKPTSGSQLLTNLTAAGTYTLSCSNSAGTTARSVTIAVAAGGGPIVIGETRVLGEDDGGNGGLLVAQQTSLPAAATVQSLSFYVTSASGSLRLGIYDATGPGGGPGAKLAETGNMTPVAGWNTAPVTAPVTLPAGSYWLAYAPSSSSLGFRMERTGNARWYSYAYGPLPSRFSTAPSSGAYHWSFYATLNPASAPPPPPPAPLPTVTLVAVPAAVSYGGSATLSWQSTGARTCTASGAWSGAKATSGSQTLTNLTATGTYTLSCSNSDGRSAAQSVTLTVSPGAGAPFTVGETGILAVNDSGNGGLLVAQQTSVPVAATIQSLSFYVSSASGELRMGIYDATGPGGGPGVKRAETASVTPVVGWNTVRVAVPVTLPAGTYWLAYAPSSSALAFRMDYTGSARWYSQPYGPLPAAFSPTPMSGAYHWSFYATLNASSAQVAVQLPAPRSTQTGAMNGAKAPTDRSAGR